VSDRPRLYVGQRVSVESATFGTRSGIIRSFRFGEDGDDLVVVDLDPSAGRQPTGATMGWVFDERQISPLNPLTQKG